MDLKQIVLVERRERIKQAVENNKAESISLVGSVARGDWGAESDFDFVVSFAPGAGLLDHAHLELDLEEILERPVDVVDRGAINKWSRRMLDDAIEL